MASSYNQIAGRSLDRIAALSDGVFAIAMTLIVLEIRVPQVGSAGTDGDLWRELTALAPAFVTYLMSFLTLGIFWNGQQTQLNFFDRADRHLTWIHLAFLAAVALMPFSTSLLADNIGLRLALVVYWLDLALLGAVLFASWSYARRAGLLREGVGPDVDGAVKRRIVAYQVAYAVATAASFVIPTVEGVAPTTWSIGLIFLTQLNSAIAPRIPWISRF